MPFPHYITREKRIAKGDRNGKKTSYHPARESGAVRTCFVGFSANPRSTRRRRCQKSGDRTAETGNFSGTSDFQSRASGSLHAAIDCRGTEDGSGLRSNGHSSLRGRNGGASRGGPGVSGFGGGGDALRTQSRSFGACGPPLRRALSRNGNRGGRLIESGDGHLAFRRSVRLQHNR